MPYEQSLPAGAHSRKAIVQTSQTPRSVSTPATTARVSTTRLEVSALFAPIPVAVGPWELLAPMRGPRMSDTQRHTAHTLPLLDVYPAPLDAYRVALFELERLGRRAELQVGRRRTWIRGPPGPG
jgi:hypothetical protein